MQKVAKSKIRKKKVIVVMPAYNASQTLRDTINDIDRRVVSEIILVDDSSTDHTYKLAKELGLRAFRHTKNLGYGGNQKTCYQKALSRGADIVVMVHPDYQYDATKIMNLIYPIIHNESDLAFGSRIRSRREALDGGMPLTKYVLNRIFCIVENFILGVNFSEHFSGFRAYSREVLNTLPIDNFSNDFVFDQELMISAIAYKFRISETPVPVRYFSEASSIQFKKGTYFLIDTLKTLSKYIIYKTKLVRSPLFYFRQNWKFVK